MSKISIPIFMYHSIQEMPKHTVMRRGLYLPPRRFAMQMKLLNIFGYKGLSMQKLQPYLEGKKTGKVVGLTFDDGYKNNVTNALPILKKYNHSATCYVVSQNIGGGNSWDIDKGIVENLIMNKKEVRLWIDSGMEIGSHTQNHIRLTVVDVEIARKEIQQSKQDLERRFNCIVNNFCYPYGSMNMEIADMVKSAGYIYSTGINRGKVIDGHDRFSLKRIPIRYHTTSFLFLLKFLSNYEDKFSKYEAKIASLVRKIAPEF